MKKNQWPPFRETKLTRYLAEFFEVDNNVIMMANINPWVEDLYESIQALNYTAIARDINYISSTKRLSLRVVSK